MIILNFLSLQLANLTTSNLMRSNKPNFLFGIIIGFIGLSHTSTGQDLIAMQANSEDISDNLDLEAVTSVFGESKDLEDFEKRLNDSDTQISNLDLNNDGEIDYLRVMETADENIHTISIQSIIGKDQYQEVATIFVEKDEKGETQAQVVGDVNMYGSNYYITPAYQVVPVFFTFFWVASYHPWHSPWYWGNHPPYFRPSTPYTAYSYRTNVQVNINVHNSYHRTNISTNNREQVSHSENNAYFKNNPNNSFDKRNPGLSNRNELSNKRNLTRNKKKYKPTASSFNQSNKLKVNSPETKPSSRPPKNQRAKPSAMPTNDSFSRLSSARQSHSYSRQAPSRTSIRRTRH